mmetsp:Transcript_9328/g.16507  ORF Transcript_9328/g.16507 Transcript_9328/m.16507 type:complete len:287 (+) Transcript_9328:67-927(+)
MSAALSFFAFFTLGMGPGLVFFGFFIAPKSFLVLLTLTSAFFWLLSLLLISAIFKGFLPVTVVASHYAGLVACSVAIQELARLGMWKIHSITAQVLSEHARSTGHRFAVLDRLYLALGWGYGHGVAHVVFFVLSFLPLTTGDGTWYLDTCPNMSIFLAGALYALAFGMLLPGCMVISFYGLQERNWLLIVYPPAMHLGASMLTLANFRRNGCLFVMPLLLVLGAGTAFYATKLGWKAVTGLDATSAARTSQRNDAVREDNGLIPGGLSSSDGGPSRRRGHNQQAID